MEEVGRSGLEEQGVADTQMGMGGPWEFRRVIAVRFRPTSCTLNIVMPYNRNVETAFEK